MTTMTVKQRRHERYLRHRAPLKGHWNSRKTSCPAGHEYTEANTYRHPIDGTRACRTCDRERKQQ